MTTQIFVDPDSCSGCGRCIAACACHAIDLFTDSADGYGTKTARIDHTLCTGCLQCIASCPRLALKNVCR